MNIIFFGTPGFAVPALKILLRSGYKIPAVVTQPDRKSGRGRRLKESPVKNEAQRAGLNIIQPEKVREKSFINSLKVLAPSVIVVVAYGQILPQDILHLPEFGCVNIHASLLPKYRGAAPINWAIVNGEETTGITTMLMDEGMDTGPVLLQEETEIRPDDTAGSLSVRLSEAGARLLIPTLRGLEDGTVVPSPQTGEASYAPVLKKTDGFIRWTGTAKEIHNFIRGMTPWPGAYGYIGNERLRILTASPLDGDGEAGKIKKATRDELHVGTGRGIISITEIQPQGKPAMEVKSFLQGRKIKEGTRFALQEPGD